MGWYKSKVSGSRYKYVLHQIIGKYEYWYINKPGYTFKRYKTEKEAAIAIDMIFIREGREPENILKSKI